MTKSPICKGTRRNGEPCTYRAKRDGLCGHCLRWENNGAKNKARANGGNGNGLNGKQSRFVDEYLVDLNATQAAIRAGYSAKTAYSIGWELLRKPEIEQAIHAAMEERAKRTQITADRVLYELARIAYANMGEYIETQEDGSAYVDLSHLSADQAAAIQEIVTDTYMDGSGDDAVPVKKVKFKLHPRTRALELLGKHRGLFTDKHEVSGPDGGPIDHQVTFYMPKNGRERDEEGD